MRRPIANHLVFAAHFAAWNLLAVMSVFLLLLTASVPFIRAFIAWSTAAGVPGMGVFEVLIFEFGTVFLWIPYLYLSVRGVYGTQRFASAVAAIALTAFLMMVTLVYRLLLFWVTFATV